MMTGSIQLVFLTLCIIVSGVELVSSQNVCTLEKETGLCLAYFRRYYFDSRSGLCKRFVYGGCGGNGNNFRTIQECRKVCGCRASPKVGRCRARIPRIYFNKRTGQCSIFFYGGCNGNENNFRTQRDCKKTCI